MAAVAQPEHRKTMMEATRPSLMAGCIPGLVETVAVGDRVTVGSAHYKGTVRFFGETSFAAGNWAGIALDDAHGKNDGSVKGFRYFECESAYGLFVRPTALTMLRPNGSNGRPLSMTWPGDESSNARQTSKEEPMRARRSVRMSEVIEEVPSLEALMSWKRSGSKEETKVQAHSIHYGSDEENNSSSSSSSKRRTSLENVDNLDWSAVGNGSSPSPVPSTRVPLSRTSPEAPSSGNGALPHVSRPSSSPRVTEEEDSPGTSPDTRRQLRRARSSPAAPQSAPKGEARIRLDGIQQELAEAIEDHDVDALRRLIPVATNLGFPSDELESARNMLNFEVQQKAFDEIEDVRSAVQRLTQAVHKAELRAAVVEEAGRNGGQPKLLKGGSQTAADNGEAWIAQVGNRLEERVWIGLEKRLEAAISGAVLRATEQLVQVASEIRGVRAPTNGNSERRPSRTRPGESEEEEDVRMRPGEISPGRSSDQRMRVGTQARERMQQKRQSVKEARSLEIEQISFAMRRNAYQCVASPLAVEEMDEVDVMMQKMELARAAAKDRLVGASTRIQAVERGRKARQSMRLNQARDPKKLWACQKIQLSVRKWQARRNHAASGCITDFASAAFAARRRHGAWAQIFDIHLQRGGASEKFPLGLTKASFSQALNDAYPFVSSDQASALWQGYTDGTDKDGVDLKGYCAIAEAVGLGPDAAAEFADLSNEAYLALGEQDAGVESSPGTAKEKAALKIQRAVRRIAARRNLQGRASFFTASEMVHSRNKACKEIYKSVCNGDGGLNLATFQQAITEVHPNLTEGQVRALWNGFARGTMRETMSIVEFSAITEAVFIGDDAASEFADISREAFVALGQAGGAEAAVRIQALYRGNIARRSLLEVLPTSIQAKELVANAIANAVRRGMLAPPLEEVMEEVARSSHPTSPLKARPARPQTPEVPMGRCSTFSNSSPMGTCATYSMDGSDQIRMDTVEERISSAQTLQRAFRTMKARRKLTGSSRFASVSCLMSLRHKAWVSVFNDAARAEKSTASIAQASNFEKAILQIHPRLSRSQVSALWEGFRSGTDKDGIGLPDFCSLAEAVAIGDDAACEYADMDEASFTRLGMDANDNSSSQESRQSSAARVLQRAERRRRARRQASGCADLHMSAVVRLVRQRFSAWAEVFDRISNDRGSLDEESLRRAIQEIHPQISDAQVNAMWRSFLEGTDRSSMELKTFCSMLEAIASGDDAAAQFADMPTDDFAALAKR